MAAVHRLFFAIFPDPAAAAAITRLSERLRDGNVVRGRWIAPEKYHLTVRFLGDHDERAAAEVAARAGAAVERACAPAIGVVFDRVATFRGRFRSPCVLRCARDADAALCALWRELGRCLDRVGLAGDDDRRFLPHLTIAYADRTLDVPIDVEPIAWLATGFALVDSHRSSHALLARWRLTG